ncbi:MAG: HAD family hydrolase, partial [Pseudomonadota bacterium]|nr:HAD family hydrolase [Pseudomonadota bacterium]
HPLAAAVVVAATEKGISPEEPSGFASVTGKGVTGTVRGRAVALGNAKLMADQGIDLGDLAAEADRLRASGATALFVGVDGGRGGIIAVADPIKTSTRAALDSLRADGIHVVMLTGDNRTTALAEADVGIAMGTGTEVAIQSAGVTLVKGDLAGIARARSLSRKTMRNIRQNLVFAFAYNAVGIPVAAGVLYPVFGILLSPVVAALAMSLSSVSVIGNALRLRAARL